MYETIYEGRENQKYAIDRLLMDVKKIAYPAVGEAKSIRMKGIHMDYCFLLADSFPLAQAIIIYFSEGNDVGKINLVIRHLNTDQKFPAIEELVKKYDLDFKETVEPVMKIHGSDEIFKGV